MWDIQQLHNETLKMTKTPKVATATGSNAKFTRLFTKGQSGVKNTIESVRHPNGSNECSHTDEMPVNAAIIRNTHAAANRQASLSQMLHSLTRSRHRPKSDCTPVRTSNKISPKDQYYPQRDSFELESNSNQPKFYASSDSSGSRNLTPILHHEFHDSSKGQQGQRCSLTDTTDTVIHDKGTNDPMMKTNADAKYRKRSSDSSFDTNGQCIENPMNSNDPLVFRSMTSQELSSALNSGPRDKTLLRLSTSMDVFKSEIHPINTTSVDTTSSGDGHKIFAEKEFQSKDNSVKLNQTRDSLHRTSSPLFADSTNKPPVDSGDQQDGSTF